MDLTGKTLEDFKLWIKKAGYPVSIWAIDNSYINNTMLNALIIEWFDSVGVEIYIYKTEGAISYHITSTNNDIQSKELNRQQAIEEAIIIANNIYNETTN